MSKTVLTIEIEKRGQFEQIEVFRDGERIGLQNLTENEREILKDITES